MLYIFVLAPDSVRRDRCYETKGLGMLILPRTVSNAKPKREELVDALTDKTSPCCSGHVKNRRLCLSFSSQSKCRRFAILLMPRLSEVLWYFTWRIAQDRTRYSPPKNDAHTRRVPKNSIFSFKTLILSSSPLNLSPTMVGSWTSFFTDFLN